jgi:uncharacterized phage protein (TIGR02218 family)
MRRLPTALEQHLAGGATTLCWCWKLIDAKGVSLGFTDHDDALAFDDVVFEASTGFTGTEIHSSLGLNVDNLDVAGALQSDSLAEEDVQAGRFDNALVELWLVNWRDPSQRLLLRKGNLGEITRGGQAFTAEIRGLAHRLNQPMGRIYQYGCDAALGDSKCALDITAPAYRAAASVAEALSRRRFAAAGLEAYAEDWFTRGLLRWTDGDNAGRNGEVRAHRRQGGVMIELWQAMASPIREGDGFIITAGCDKQFSTCKAKFNNALNFRGYPHMPGSDFVLSYASHD